MYLSCVLILQTAQVAHAAALPPRGRHDVHSQEAKKEKGRGQGRYGVMLSLSGVGVTPLQQAESHKHVPKGKADFVFGYKTQWVLAPERDG